MAKQHPHSGLDQIDIAILSILEENARRPMKEIAELVGVAPSTCNLRIKSLESRGVIQRHHTELNLKKMGRGLEALITIRLHAHARAQINKFRDWLKHLEAVESIYFVAGDRDFLIHVAVADTDELRELVANNLSIRPEVAGTNTSVIFEHIRV